MRISWGCKTLMFLAITPEPRPIQFLPSICSYLCVLSLHKNEIQFRRLLRLWLNSVTENVCVKEMRVREQTHTLTRRQTHMLRNSFCCACFLLSVISQRNKLHCIKSPETINHMKSVASQLHWQTTNTSWQRCENGSRAPAQRKKWNVFLL